MAEPPPAAPDPVTLAVLDNRLRAIVEEASEVGANRVLTRLGLSDPGAQDDIDELRELLRAWRDAGLPPVVVAVNMSATEFNQRTLVEEVQLVLADTGIDPQWLECARAHVQRQRSRAYAARAQVREQGVVEMQAGRRCRDGARLRREHGLIALGIETARGVFDVRRQR